MVTSADNAIIARPRIATADLEGSWFAMKRHRTAPHTGLWMDSAGRRSDDSAHQHELERRRDFDSLPTADPRPGLGPAPPASPVSTTAAPPPSPFRDTGLPRIAGTTSQRLKAVRIHLDDRTNALERATQSLRRTERELVLQGKVLRTLLDSIGDAVLLHDHRGDIIEANRMASEQLGYTRVELLQMQITQLETAPRNLRDLDELGENDRGTLEVNHLRRDGSTYPVEMRVATLPFRGKRHFVVVARDITERKRYDQLRKALLDEVIEAQELQRSDIARELHDGPCQVLTSALMHLDAVAATLQPEARSALTGVRHHVRKAVDELRNVAHVLRPPMLDELGLVAALERLASETRNAELRVSFVATGQSSLDNLAPNVSTALYRMTQESLQNVIKHADASCVSIVVSATDRLRLVIEDDGCGFDVDAAHEQRSVGLIGLQERAGLIDGTVMIESEPGAGTAVIVNVPLEAAR